jgi:hypothetical protein
MNQRDSRARIFCVDFAANAAFWRGKGKFLLYFRARDWAKSLGKRRES